MDDLQKAKILVKDKNVSLDLLSKKSGISLFTLRHYRTDASKLQKATWERVHKLAKIYDQRQQKMPPLNKKQ